ncbi:MAG: hypothetical protein J1F32_04735 [Erysipelotrichales bacterium]|nr:hypothetical protein [Erysipelotrichales bacterium]
MKVHCLRPKITNGSVQKDTFSVKIKNNSSTFTIKNNVEYQVHAREAAHHILYTVVNSAAMNGNVRGVRFVSGFAYYKIIVVVCSYHWWNCIVNF